MDAAVPRAWPSSCRVRRCRGPRTRRFGRRVTGEGMMRKARLTAAEIDNYLKLVAMLPMPGDAAEQLAARLRPWAEADDGKPTYVCVTVADNGHPGLRYVAGSSCATGAAPALAVGMPAGSARAGARSSRRPVTTRCAAVMATAAVNAHTITVACWGNRNSRT